MQADIRCALGWALLLTGRAQEAVSIVEEEPNAHIGLAVLVIACREAGDLARSDSVLAELVSKYGESNPIVVALASAWRGEADRAFEVLEGAVQIRDPFLYELLFLGWAFRSMEADPRWLPFLERNGMAPGRVGPIDFEIPLSNASAPLREVRLA